MKNQAIHGAEGEKISSYMIGLSLEIYIEYTVHIGGFLPFLGPMIRLIPCVKCTIVSFIECITRFSLVLLVV